MTELSIRTGLQDDSFDILRITLVLLLPIVAILFARDIFAVDTAAGRYSLFEVVAVIFLVFAAVDLREFVINKASGLVIAAFFGFGVTGAISTAYIWSVGWLPEPALAVIDSLRYLLFGTLLLVLHQYLYDDRLRTYYLYTWIAIIPIVILIGIAQSFAIAGIWLFESLFFWENIRGGEEELRIASTFRWQGPLTAYLGLSLPFISALLARADKYRNQFIFGIILIGGILVIGLSGSRSGLLVLPLVLAPLAGHLRSPAHIAGISLAGAASTVAAYLYGPAAMQRLIDRSIELILAPHEAGRVVRWIDAIHLWLTTSPLFGIGPRQLAFKLDHHAHSSYVGIPVDRGLFGLFVLVVFVWALLLIAATLLYERNRRQRNWAIYVGAAMGIGNLLIYAIAAEGFSYRMNVVFLALALAVYNTTVEAPANQWCLSLGDRGNNRKIQSHH